MTSFEDKISLMIPAYLRGELSESDRKEVETLAAKNPEIAADIEFQKNLKSALAKDENAYEPGDLGWARLSKAMENSDEGPNEAAKKPKFWRYAAAVLAVAVIGQAGVLGSMAFNKGQDAQYVTVSETSKAADTIKLGLHKELTVNQLTQILQLVDGSIIAGPSALGLYQVQFKSGSECLTAIDSLQKQRDVVDTVTSCE